MFAARRSLALLGALLLLHMALTLPHHHACMGQDCSGPLPGLAEGAGRALPRQLLLQMDAAAAGGGGGGGGGGARAAGAAGAAGAGAAVGAGILPGPLLEEPPRPPAAHPNQTIEQVLETLAQGKPPLLARPEVVCLVSTQRPAADLCAAGARPGA
jgi:hypothetical protein